MLKTANKWPKVNRMKTLFVAYTLLLFLVSVLPINSSGAAINHTFVVSIRLDYLLHCIIFIPWVFLLQRNHPFNFRSNLIKTLGWLVIGVLFALTMEAVQYFLPYRAFNINDLLANGLGVVLGFVLLRLGVLKPFGINKRYIGEN